MLIAGLPATSQAAPGPVLKPPAQAELVQEAGYYKRRWRYRNGTYVRAPSPRSTTPAPMRARPSLASIAAAGHVGESAHLRRKLR
jgi:hypothetical protein